jgi:pyrroline-5-carboxylate reductase
MSTKNISIIGAGNLGISIAQGLVEKGLRSQSEIILTRRHTDGLKKLASQGYQIMTSNLEAAKHSKIVMLCVQPRQLAKVLEEISPVLNETHILVSVITGVSLAEIKSQVPVNITVIRAMPNTAIAIGESMTCLTSTDGEAELKEIQTLFDALGKTLIIDEKLMQAGTVLGASGIAFFMRFLRAATQGGVQMGFHSDEAQLIAVQTAKGAASLILENNQHPEVEIDKVTTPQGCTIAGLNEMEHQGLSSAIIKGLMVSYERISNIK